MKHTLAMTGLLTMSLLPAAAKSPAVLSGLDITTKGERITVSPGKLTIAGRTVEVSAPVTLRVAPAEALAIENEAYVLSNDKPHVYIAGTHLRGCISAATAIPGCLTPGSVRVRLPDGTRMEEGRDYLLDPVWAAMGRVAGGRIPDGGLALISYRAGQQRLDSVAVYSDGTMRLVRGAPGRRGVAPPPIGSNAVRLANVYLPFNAKTVEDWQVFPVEASFPEPDSAEMARRGALVPKTLAKLRNGEPVTIVTWGDSVTEGGDASVPDRCFAALFPKRLGQRFPKATIRAINAGIGATNTDGRLPGLDKDVLSHKPDLVTIEFVNDITLMDDEHIRRNWRTAIDRIRATGAEVIAITPHFNWLPEMRKEHPRGPETRSGVTVLREVASEKGVALADASKRWEHLDVEGIPYMALLDNSINHPDDRGHGFYVTELMTFFPAEP